MDDATYRVMYPKLAHALQSGVAATLSLDENDTTITLSARSHGGKMLRTGINMAMVEQGAIWQLLLDKGIITEDEMRQALVDGLTKEVTRYEIELTKRMGRPVTLG
jgi:hypothetical protein